jgi:hypothetical protein
MEQHAPLVGLVERLRWEGLELFIGRWGPPWGEEFEAKQRSLSIARATLWQMQRQQQEAAASPGGGTKGGWGAACRGGRHRVAGGPGK